jgi:predicted TIM-barrel fold metal-dependent hydrolase
MSPPHTEPGWDCHVHVFDGAALAAPGHYAPQHRPLAAIEALAHSHGFGHLVLVQPSVYGTDNSVLLNALRVQPGRHRGVMVVDVSSADAISDVSLGHLHSQGVRGVRFNLVSPAGNSSNFAADFATLAPRLQALGWHVQWYARPEDLPLISSLHLTTTVPAVLDHLAGMHANLPADHAAWQALEQLAGQGAWVKLSGWYRLQAVSPYAALGSNIARVAKLFAGHLLWGSDWPHTSFHPEAMPSYDSTLQPVFWALTEAEKMDVLEHAPRRLYT